MQLTAGSLEVTDQGLVGTLASSTGAGGPLTIDAQSVFVSNATAEIEGQSTLISSMTTADGGQGCCKGGDLTIRTTSLEVVDGGQVQSITKGSGEAGQLIVEADLVRVRGRNALDKASEAAIVSRVYDDKGTATGNGGLLSIDSRILEVEDGGFVSSDTSDEGNAGGLEIIATKRVSVTGGLEGGKALITAGSFASENDPNVVGEAGDLTIETDVLELSKGGQVSTSTSGTGSAGSVTIAARRVSVSGVDPTNPANRSGVFAQSLPQMDPDALAGEIRITAAEDVTVSDGGTISVSTSGPGDAGAIVIDSEHSVRLERGGTVRAETLASPGGRGGSIRVIARDSVELSDAAHISATSGGSGAAGGIHIEGRRLHLTDGSSITTDARKASGGTIDIDVQEMVALVDSEFTTSVFGAGGGGDIRAVSEAVVLNRSAIKANSEEGRGGLVSIVADVLLKSADSTIEAKAPPGLEGVVEIVAQEPDLTSKLESLSQSFLDASALLGGACGARMGRAGSFVAQRWAALPPPPDATLSRSATAPAVATGGPECPPGEVTP
jgi:large exoprotein involved in heme utilization and adhesion